MPSLAFAKNSRFHPIITLVYQNTPEDFATIARRSAAMRRGVRAMERARVSETRGRRHGGVGLLDRKSEQISGAVELFSLAGCARARDHRPTESVNFHRDFFSLKGFFS